MIIINNLLVVKLLVKTYFSIFNFLSRYFFNMKFPKTNLKNSLIYVPFMNRNSPDIDVFVIKINP